MVQRNGPRSVPHCDRCIPGMSDANTGDQRASSIGVLFVLTLQSLYTTEIFPKKPPLYLQRKPAGRGEKMPAFYPTQDRNTCNVQHAKAAANNLSSEGRQHRQQGDTVMTSTGLRELGTAWRHRCPKGGHRRPRSPRAARRHRGERC